jgi:hypothetical protein
MHKNFYPNNYIEEKYNKIKFWDNNKNVWYILFFIKNNSMSLSCEWKITFNKKYLAIQVKIFEMLCLQEIHTLIFCDTSQTVFV